MKLLKDHEVCYARRNTDRRKKLSRSYFFRSAPPKLGRYGYVSAKYKLTSPTAAGNFRI